MQKWLLAAIGFGIVQAGCNLIVGNHEYSLGGDATADGAGSGDDAPGAASESDGGFDATAAADAHVDHDAQPPADGEALADGQAPADGQALADGSPSDASDAAEEPPPPPEKAAKGADCSDGGDCMTGLVCADGVCCDRACNGSCEACNLADFKGTCSPVAQAQAPSTGHPTCVSAEASTCGEDGKCDGKGACEFASNGTACGGSVCSTAANEVTNGSACDGKGNCAAGTAVTCAPFKCATGGTACSKTCSTSNDCVGEPCVNGSCGTVANGSACTSNSQCTNNQCVDGYCCDMPCTGSCQACDVAGKQGMCTTLTSGQPHGSRAACTGSGTCQGSCGGSTSCTYPTAVCAVQSCASGVEMLAASCNGAGACATQSTQACAGGYACNGSSCYTSCTSDAQCAPATPYCNTATGACQSKLPQGRSCTSGTQCASTDCVDGYCCNSACSSSCQACDVSGSPGTCTTVTSGQPHGSRGACAGSGVCQGSCTGASASCSFPTVACTSQSCSGGTVMHASSCNGAGGCSSQTTSSCGGYACNGTGCYTSCTGDGQCAGGTPYCNGSSCASTAPLGHSCSSSGQCGSGLCCGSVCVGAYNNSTNCGACGHNCGSGTCGSSSTGACSAFTFVSSGASDIVSLASDGTVVVWADSGNSAIDIVTTPGGSVTPLANVSSPSGVSINTSTETVMWLSQGTNNWMFGCAKVPPAVDTQNAVLDGTLFPIADPVYGPLSSGAILPWGTSTNVGIHPFIATCGSSAVTEGPTTGGTSSNAAGPGFAETSSAFVVEDIAGGLVYVSNGLSSGASFSSFAGYELNMATDGSYVYFAPGSVARVLPPSVTPTTIYSGSDASGPVATDGTFVYFATTSGIAYAPVGQVSGGATLLTTLNPVVNLVYASGALYFNVGTVIYKMVTPLH